MILSAIAAATTLLLCEPAMHQVCSSAGCRIETTAFHVLVDLDRATLARCHETVHGCTIDKVTIDRGGEADSIVVEARDLKFRLWPSLDYMEVRLAEAKTDVSFGKCKTKQ